jgi:hypothetical protein
MNRSLGFGSDRRNWGPGVRKKTPYEEFRSACAMPQPLHWRPSACSGDQVTGPLCKRYARTGAGLLSGFRSSGAGDFSIFFRILFHRSFTVLVHYRTETGVKPSKVVLRIFSQRGGLRDTSTGGVKNSNTSKKMESSRLSREGVVFQSVRLQGHSKFS